VKSSVPANSKNAELVPVCGARSMVVSGGALSAGSRTSHSYSAGSSSSTPLASMETTRSMCSPGACSPVKVTGGVHGSNGSRSSEHRYVASATLARKSIVAVFSCTSPPVAGSPSVPGVKPGPERNSVTTPSRRQV
jgi:hypothetical protein